VNFEGRLWKSGEMVTGDAEGQRLVALLRRAGETRVWRKKMARHGGQAGGDGAGGSETSKKKAESKPAP